MASAQAHFLQRNTVRHPAARDTAPSPRNRLSDAFAGILERFIETYLGTDKPLKLDWYWRYACAWFGIAVFVVVALLTVLAAPPQFLAYSGPAAALFSEVADEIVVAVVLLFVSILAAVIMKSIVNGGPIRLFLVGVTLPALVLYIATAATAVRSDSPTSEPPAVEGQ